MVQGVSFKSPLYQRTQTTGTCLWNDSAAEAESGVRARSRSGGRAAMLLPSLTPIAVGTADCPFRQIRGCSVMGQAFCDTQST